MKYIMVIMTILGIVGIGYAETEIKFWKVDNIVVLEYVEDNGERTMTRMVA